MQYYYQKHKVIEEPIFSENTFGQNDYSYGALDVKITLYESYKFDQNLGYIGDGNSIVKSFREVINEGLSGQTWYIQDKTDPNVHPITQGKGYFVVARWNLGIADDGLNATSWRKQIVPIYQYSNYYRGEYIETLLAEDGTYPSNGRASDGFWYVKVSQLNVPPNAPIITSPTGDDVITAPFPIRFNPATDDNGDTIVSHQVELTTNNGKEWIRIADNYKGTSLLYDFAGKPDTSTAKIRVRGYDGALYGAWGESEGTFTINYNYPPNPPYMLSPNSEIVDKDKTIRLQWMHSDPNESDPQSKFELRWRLKGSSSWNNLSEITTRQYQDISPNTFPLGEIEWQVRTYDQAGLVSEWSYLSTFTSGSKPEAPIWIDPINQQKITEAIPVFRWSSNVQTAYRVILYDENDFIVWDTGEKEGITKAVACGITLEDGGIYTVSVLIRNTENFWSDEVKSSFSTSYSPPPKPRMTLYGSDASIIIQIDNPESEGLEPQTIKNEIYKLIDKEWIRIAKDIPLNSTFVDYTSRSGIAEQYQIKAIGDNEGIQYSEIQSLSVTFRGVYLHDTHDPGLTVKQFKFDGGGRSSNWSKVYTMMKFKGRKMPVVEFSESENRSISVTLQLLNSEDLLALEELARSYNTLCYRDGRGRLLFGFIPSLPASDERFGHQVQFEFIGIDYKGSV